MFDVKRKLNVSLASKRIKFLGRSIIFMAVLVLQLLVWYYVIFWIRFVCLYCCMGSIARSCPYFECQLPYPTVNMECSPW